MNNDQLTRSLKDMVKNDKISIEKRAMIAGNLAILHNDIESTIDLIAEDAKQDGRLLSTDTLDYLIGTITPGGESPDLMTEADVPDVYRRGSALEQG